MSIIGKVGRLIFGTSGDPAEHTQSVPHSVGRTVGELQGEPMSAWGNDDIIKGLRFCATMQLRTPLRILLRHGEIHTNKNSRPPEITREGTETMWAGIWLPVVFDGPPIGTMASDVGQVPVDGGTYLPFLIAVRKIVESHSSIERRIEQLREKPMVGNWKTYVEKLGGIGSIIGMFFPDFIHTIPKTNFAIAVELSDLGLDTPNRIAAASDETLLNIKGIGQAKLNAIRDYCAGITDNRDADTVENVTR